MWGEIFSGAGALGSAIGGAIGAGAAGRAGRRARDTYDWRTHQGIGRYLLGLFGEDAGGAVDAMFKPTERRFIRDETGIDTPEARAFSARYPGYMSVMGRIADNIPAQNAQLLGGYTDLEGGVNDLYARRVAEARAWGSGRAAEIDEDTQRAVGRAKAGIDARARAAGMYGSTMPGQLGAAAEIEGARQGSRLKTEVSMGTIDRALRAMEDQARTKTGLGTTRLGVQAGLMGRQDEARERMAGTVMQALGSGIFNPHLGQDTTRFYPGQSGLGTALTSLGNGLVTFGSQRMANDRLNDLLLALGGRTR